MAVSRGIWAFFFFTVFLEAMGGGLTGPVLPSLLTKLSSTELSGVSALYGWYIAIFSIALFVFSPLMGQLADRFGRRPIVLLSLSGAVLDYTVAATTRVLWVLFLARALSGVLASGCVAVQAVVADVTPVNERARNYAIFGAGFGVGMVIGPPIGGVLGHWSPEYPFWVAAVLFAIDFLLASVVLQETLPKHERRTLVFTNSNPILALIRITRFPLGVLLPVFVLVQFADAVESSVMVLFTQKKFSWSPQQIGVYYSAVGICLFLSKGMLTPFVLSRFAERRTVLFGMFAHSMCCLLYGLATQAWQMYLGLSLWLLGSMAAPTLMGLMSGAVPLAEQGEYLGSLLSLQVVTGTAATLIGTTIFGYFTSPEAPLVAPGAPFILCSLVFATALGLYARNGVAATEATR
jgi:MFS transporter, DHA1 family, tetracycline resistance protein